MLNIPPSSAEFAEFATPRLERGWAQLRDAGFFHYADHVQAAVITDATHDVREFLEHTNQIIDDTRELVGNLALMYLRDAGKLIYV